ncbi:solute carrier family 2, facilitated glucose transporter member 12-like isoform X2 [Mizuhopecten yessoensis]|uniref:solute carrier family 2, facilitated glucose transporter member 12-like isoform X2 n=1 Tax=Mizuhopecten yessoensis TaxID=6573 RepID=UPI000B45AAB2|nr:solute carrier family 2, facilitated glucose transporter member 12-like isoform X2 [Mizuhopecten yessoensis]
MENEDLQEGEILLKNYTSLHGSLDSDLDQDPLQVIQVQLEDRHLDTSPVVSPTHHQRPSEVSPNCYLGLAAVMASLGGILFGYDIGIISGAVLQLQDQFCLSCFQRELVISIMLVGAMIGSLFGGFVIDKYGRRLTIILNAVVFLVGAFILALSTSYPLILFGRLVIGIAVAVSATGECVYISEIAPAKKRGVLVSLNELGITLGLLLAYLVNYFFIQVDNGWRYMFGLSAIPAVIQGVGMMFLPKSPRFLMLKRQEAKSQEVLMKLRGKDVEKEMNAMKISIAGEMNQTCCSLFSSVDNMRGRMLIGAGLVFFQQFTGQPNVLYYAPTIFEAIGFGSHSAATLATVGLGAVKVVMTVIALLCVDKWGRRKFLLTGAILMGVAILCLGLVTHLQNHTLSKETCSETEVCVPSSGNHIHQVFLYNQSYSITGVNLTNSGLATQSNSTGDTPLVHGDKAGRVVAFISLMTFVAAYAIGFGPVTWLVLSEIFPASVKGRAIGMTTVLNWGTNLVVSSTFLNVIDELGVSLTFFIFSLICAFSTGFIFLFVPETKGRSLEQISSDLTKSCVVGKCPCS